MRLLLVEDDPGIGRIVTKGLEAEGFQIEWVRSARSALEAVNLAAPHMIVLDLMLPDMDGILLARRLRVAGLTAPILMLTARTALEEKLEGFRSGADDYITKPFHFEELLARVRAHAKNATRQSATFEIRLGQLVIERHSREAKVRLQSLDLTRTEFDVLVCLALNARQVLSREQIIAQAWPGDAEITPNAVDVYVGYVRRKLAALKGAPEIKTVRGVGYMIVDASDPY